MAIAFDVSTVATAYTSTGTQTTSHAGSASARGAVVLIDQNGTAADEVSGVTYGGAAMTRLRFDVESTEAGGVYIYWLDGVATGTQNVAMTTSAATNKQLVVATMTVASGRGVEVAGNATGTSASVANPAWSITGLTAATVLDGFEVIHSGLQTMTTTPATSWTLISSTDLGAQGRGFARQHVASSGTSLACGWTASTADDFVGASVAFYEVTPAAPTGTLATTLDDSVLAATGTVANPVTGTLATTLDDSVLAATGTVPYQKSNTFEMGSNGVAISAANSSSPTDDAISGAVGTTLPTFTSTTPIHGTLSVHCAAAASASSYPYWASTAALAPHSYQRAYFRVPNPIPAGTIYFLASKNTASNTNGTHLRLNSTGHVELCNSADAVVATSTTVLVAGAVFRAELHHYVNGASGQAEGRLFVGTNVEGATPDETLGPVTGDFGTIVGQQRAGIDWATVAATIDFDDWAVSSADWIGTSGSSGVTGTLATVLDDSILAAAGAETISGTLATTLDDSVLAASGTSGSSGATGTLAVTLDDSVLAASAVETFTGTLASTLDDSVLAASGTETISGSWAATLGDAALAATGTETVSGTLASTLDDSVLAASGAETITGTLASTLDDAVLAASGTSVSGVTGTLATTLDDAILTATGSEILSGTFTATLDDAVLTAAGTVILPVTGTLVTVLEDAQMTAVGTETFTGTLTVTLDDSVLTATGAVTTSRELTFTYAVGTDRWTAEAGTGRWADVSGADRWTDANATDRWVDQNGTDRWTATTGSQ